MYYPLTSSQTVPPPKQAQPLFPLTPEYFRIPSRFYKIVSILLSHASQSYSHNGANPCFVLFCVLLGQAGEEKALVTEVSWERKRNTDVDEGAKDGTQVILVTNFVT